MAFFLYFLILSAVLRSIELKKLNFKVIAQRRKIDKKAKADKLEK
jgi:hypothetical protein